MHNKDSFDDPATAGIFAGIVRALSARHRYAARGPLSAVALVVATAAVVAAVFYYAYPREAARLENAAAPIIRADAAPLKVTPDDPGGMQIAHRDSTVFDAVSGNGPRRIENLLPPAEQPLQRTEMFASFKTDFADVEGTEEPLSAAEEETLQPFAAEPAPIKQEQAAPIVPATPAAPVAVAVSVPEERKVADDAARTEPAAGATAAAREVAAGTHYVQLASVRDEAAARTEWAKLQIAHSALAPLKLNVQRADLGERGVFYRIQGGPVAEDAARAICKSITDKTAGGCLVVRP